MIQFAIAILFAGALADDGSARLTLLDGTTVVGRISTWDETLVGVDTADGAREVLHSQLLDLRLPRNEAEAESAAEMTVELVDGACIVSTSYTTDGRTATIETPYAEQPLRIETAKIERVELQGATDASADLWREIAEREIAGDVLLVTSRDGAKLDYLQGVVGAVTEARIAFDWDGEEVAINRAKAAGIAYFHAEPPQFDEAVCELVLLDGSKIPARQAVLDDEERLSVTTPAGAKLFVPLEQVVRADFSRGKLAYLSDLEPVEVEWTPRIALPTSATLIAEFGQPRNDVSYSGSPLSLAWPDESLPAGHELRTYEKGLAMRSRTDLEYRLPPGMQRFAAIAGIDPATAAEGHVVLEIRADGLMLWEGEIDGKREPVELELDLGAARRLQFHVDYGRNLDYGDCLHLVEARVTK